MKYSLSDIFRRTEHIVCLLILSICLFSEVQAQDKLYTYKELAQEAINVVNRPEVTGIEETDDTTYTIYSGNFVDFKVYFVHGEQYHHILNPNPTGMYINGVHYNFYCSEEMATRKNTSNFLDIYEFTYLNKKYLALMNYREDCIMSGCRYRCFNVYDVTDVAHIDPYSFTSVYSETESFGDFNNDGMLDFLRAAPKIPDSMKDEVKEDFDNYCLMTVYTFDNGKPKALMKEGSSYYMYVKGTDPELTNFSVLQSDWFFQMKDIKGNPLENTSYFPPYISFDPKNNFLYDVNGFRVEKNQYVVHVANYFEIDGAIDYCTELKEQGYEDVFIMIDQYNRELTFMVLLGNYKTKDKADDLITKLSADGLEGKVLNLKKDL